MPLTSILNGGSLGTIRAALNAMFTELYPQSTPFATAIPLDANRYMPRQAVSGATAFTVASGPVPGKQCTLTLISNGINTPTFSGMIEDSSSQGWLSTNGAVNNLQFWADDVAVYYAVRQAASPQIIIQPASAYTLSGPTSLTVSVASGNYTVQAPGSLSAAVTITPSDGGGGGTFTPTTVTLASGNNSSATFTYTPSTSGSKTISTTNSSTLTNPSPISATVAISSSVQYVRFAAGSMTGLTESVDGSGYDYTPTTTPVNTYSNTNNIAVSTIAIPASTDGFFGATLLASTTFGVILGLGPNTLSGFSGSSYAMYNATGSSSNWIILTNGAATSSGVNAVPCAAGDIPRMRRSGTTIVAEVSKDGGSTFTTVYTWTGVATTALYGRYQTGNNTNPIKLPFASTNAA